jgi:hypothetical protein
MKVSSADFVMETVHCKTHDNVKFQADFDPFQLITYFSEIEIYPDKELGFHCHNSLCAFVDDGRTCFS